MNTIREDAETQKPTSGAQAIPEDRTFQIGDRRYRLTRLKASSDKYGPCEVCKKHVADMCYQVEEKYYRHTSGQHPFQEGWTHADCSSIFGHDACLRARRRGRYVGSIDGAKNTCDIHFDGLALEQLQALGFESHADYDAHQLTLERAAAMSRSQAVIVAEGPWCVLPASSTQKLALAYACVQACGESFYRVYDAQSRVVMTANPGPKDPETGAVPVAVIWKGEGVEEGTAEHDAMVEAVRYRFIAGPVDETSRPWSDHA